MARYTDSVCRLCRREGQKLFLKGDRCYGPKCSVAKRPTPPGQHGQSRKKVSQYGIQLREKQKTRRAYGVLESLFRKYYEKAAREKGINAGLIRPITLWPFPVNAIDAACSLAKEFLSVEMNMGQMIDDVRLVSNGRVPVSFYGRTGGMIPTPHEVLQKIEEIRKKVGD